MSKCIVCNNENFEPIYNKALLRCNDCGFITANLKIDKSELQKIYSEKYFKGEEYLDYLADKPAIQKNFLKRLSKIKSENKGHHINNALEIGCAYGFFAEAFRKTFPNAEYLGIDIVDKAIEYGCQQLKQNLFLADYLGFAMKKQYSDVFMWDVIEHLPEPQKFIEKISSELEVGGRLYITTGDISALLPKIQKNKWRMIHPPTHLHYFSKQTITMLLQKYGFEILTISYPQMYRSIKQTFFSLFLLNKRQGILKKEIYNLIPEKIFFPINTFDIMFVTSKKIVYVN